MRTRCRVLISGSTNPWFNLATEDWIFREFPPEEHVLLLWRNDPSVVIGRHQNPWRECDLFRMTAEDVLLARRQSGGGAVYHDRGNTNFTFISPTSEYSRDKNFATVLRALHALGIDAIRSERNDILVPAAGEQLCKVSGNAFKHTRERSFHHGTLLIGSDLGRLRRYLTPDSNRLEARGTRSVSSPVINLSEIMPGLTHEIVCDALSREVLAAGHLPEHLNQESLAAIPSLAEYYSRISEWAWLFGMTPAFVHTLTTESGAILDLEVRGGRISDVVIHSRKQYTGVESNRVTSLLQGKRYDRRELLEALPRENMADLSSVIAREIP
jgi:lipoate---protein ligase